MNMIYTAAVNDRYILKSSSLTELKRSASRAANRVLRAEDRMVVTARSGGELLSRVVFRRVNESRDCRGRWEECPA